WQWPRWGFCGDDWTTGPPEGSQACPRAGTLPVGVPMKRDMDYIRELLLEIEEAPAEELWSREAANPTPDLPRLSQHLKLLQDAGLIDAEEHTVYLGGGELWYGVRLTWAGHEFL